MIVHSAVLDISLEAARHVGLPDNHIVLLDKPTDAIDACQKSTALSHETVPDLINKGLDQPCYFIERALAPGEGRTRVALLSWSSGTTGTPKVGAQVFLSDWP